MKTGLIKEIVKDWAESIGPINFTIGDLMMFAFDEVVSGQEVEKAVFSLANDGFLSYDKPINNPIGKQIPSFRLAIS